MRIALFPKYILLFLAAAAISQLVTACSASTTASTSSAANRKAEAPIVPSMAQKRATEERAAAAKRADAVRIAAERRADTERVAAEKRAARIPMHDYWVAASGALDTATASSHDAATALSDGDSVSASADFSNCASQASDALMSSDKDVPDGWSDVSEALGAAASELEDACKAAVNAVDDQKPSEVADVQSKLKDFQMARMMAVFKAIALFTAAGGDAKNM